MPVTPEMLKEASLMWNRIRSRIADAALSRLLSTETRIRRLREAMEDEEGAMTIEYILIIALIAIIIITLFTVLLWPILRPALTSLIDRITNAINGGGIT
jgi:Flp pilus assembly pilin Flp